jgi:CRP-like cAMP-binding protein
MLQDTHLRSVILEQTLAYQEVLKTRILCASYRHARKRICAVLVYLINRFGMPYGDDIVVDVPMSHADIAEATGLARETVTRELRQLLADEVIAYRGKTITVRDTARLKQILESA